MSSYNYLSGLTAVDSSSVGTTESVKQYYALTLAKEAMKSAFGDGMEFELVYQALLDTVSANSSSDTKDIISNLSGASLEDLDVNSYNSYINSLMLNKDTSNSSDNMEEIYKLVDKYSKEYDVDPKLVLAVMQTESNYDATAVSSAGAKGLMQLMDSVCTDYKVSNPFDKEQNIKAGVNLLSDLLNRYNGDTAMALMAYNAGSGTVASRGVKSVSDIYKMPLETQNYYKKVMALMNN